MEELEGRRFLDPVHPDDVDATLAAVDSLGHNHPETESVNRYRSADGAHRCLEWRSRPFLKEVDLPA